MAVENPILDLKRLDELLCLRLLDTPPEEPFDRLTRLAARSLRAPVALISLVDDHRQFFKSCHGLPEPWCTDRETPLSHSFCQHVVASASPLVIEDARSHPLTFGNPAVTEMNVIAYLGVPLITPAGNTLGSFCVIAPEPRPWSHDDKEMMTDLAASVMSEIALRCAHDDLLAANTELIRQAAAREAPFKRLTESQVRLSAAQRLANVGSFELHNISSADISSAGGNWSDEARRLLAQEGSEPPSTIAAFVTEIVHPDDRERVANAIEYAIASRKRTEIEYRTLLPGGQVRTLLTAIEPGTGPADSPAVLCTALDITDRKEADAKLSDQRSQLLHVARVATAGEMAAVMAHEINQPLAAISHTANACERLLESGRLERAELQGHLSDMARQAKRASEIIRRIGSFVRKQPTMHASVDLERVVSDVVTLLAPMFWRNNIQIGRGPHLDHSFVAGDEIQLVQLVANIVRNAIDAVADNPLGARHVAVAIVRPAAGRLEITVADNGPGIAEDARGRLFEPFFTTRPTGLGMGLAISRTIADAHGAALSLDKPQSDVFRTVFRIGFMEEIEPGG